MKTLTFLLTVSICFFSGCQSNTTADSSINSNMEDNTTDANKGQAFIEDDGSTPNILQIAIGSKDHTTLVAAVQAAELENSLANAGPLTVFAPTNEAFAALPDGIVENLLKSENKGTLADIIKYHATPGNLNAEFMKNFKKLGMANDKSVAVEVVDGEVLVGGAKILGSVPAGNGIVHVIDKVLLPPNE